MRARLGGFLELGVGQGEEEFFYGWRIEPAFRDRGTENGDGVLRGAGS